VVASAVDTVVASAVDTVVASAVGTVVASAVGTVPPEKVLIVTMLSQDFGRQVYPLLPHFRILLDSFSCNKIILL